MKDTGNLFYRDEWEQFYKVDWTTTNGVLDITSVVMTPFKWGEPRQGQIVGGILYRRGVITVTRQVLRANAQGYEVVAEGVSQYEDLIQMNFPCGGGPKDVFKFHCDRPVVDEVVAVMTDGPRWADPESSVDDDMVWGDVAADGSAVDVTPGIGFEFINVWG